MTARITLALLFITAAALAYPWRTTVDRWVLGTAVIVVILAFAWWRGLFGTEIVGRRLGIWRRNRRGGGHTRRAADPEETVTALLRIEPPTPGPLPLPVIAGYVDRYGVRADKVRVVSRAAAGETTTWLALTVNAADNLAALRARSPRLPLRATADIAARRLADRLRELGWGITIVADADTPVPASARETWRGLRTEAGYVAAYQIAVDDGLADTLAAVAAHPSAQTWTVVDITGSTGRLELTVGCALHSEQRPEPGAPLPGLKPVRGRHGPALAAMAPLSTKRLEGRPVAVPAGMPAGLSWPAARTGASEFSGS